MLIMMYYDLDLYLFANAALTFPAIFLLGVPHVGLSSSLTIPVHRNGLPRLFFPSQYRFNCVFVAFRLVVFLSVYLNPNPATLKASSR